MLIPDQNVRDLTEIPANVKNALEIVPVKWIDQVLEHALSKQPTPLADEEESPSVAKPVEAIADSKKIKPASDTLPH